MVPGAMRVTFWGALGMGVTAGAGALLRLFEIKPKANCAASY
jgi:hypothetical protein